MGEVGYLSWNGKRVLVTGAGGFIGSHLTERLVNEGAQVDAFVRYNSRNDVGLLKLLPPDVRSSVNVIFGDIRDSEAVRGAVNGSEIVFHLAALVGIPYSYVNPSEVVDVNVLGTLNVLNAARAADVSRVVHTSTSEVYGTAREVPITEDHPLQPQSPYSASKVGADSIAHSYWRSFDLPVATIRPFNTFGPRQSGRAVIPTIVGQALHTDEVRLGNVTPTRDLTFVSDTVNAFLLLAQCDDAVGRVLNVGNGKEISVEQLAHKIIQLVGRDVPLVVTDERKREDASEVFRLICGAERAKEIAGWEPKVHLNQGLEAVIEFINTRPDWTTLERYEV